MDGTLKDQYPRPKRGPLTSSIMVRRRKARPRDRVEESLEPITLQSLNKIILLEKKSQGKIAPASIQIGKSKFNLEMGRKEKPSSGRVRTPDRIRD